MREQTFCAFLTLASLRLAVKSGETLLTTQVSSDVSGCRQPGPGVISSSRCLMKLQISPPFRHHLFLVQPTHSLPQQHACMWHVAYEHRRLFLGPFRVLTRRHGVFKNGFLPLSNPVITNSSRTYLPNLSWKFVMKFRQVPVGYKNDTGF